LVHTLQLQKNANEFPYVVYPYAIATKNEVRLDLKITFTFRKYDHRNEDLMEVYEEVVCIGVLNSSQRLPLYQSTFAAPNIEPQQRRSLPYKEPKLQQSNTQERNICQGFSFFFFFSFKFFF
jgi:hypothetical protein